MMKTLLTTLTLLVCSLSLSLARTVELTPENLEIRGETGPFEATLSTREEEPGVQIVTVKLQADEPAKPPKFTVTWNIPSVDIQGFWLPTTKVDKATYYTINVTSRAATYAPVVNLHSVADRNRFTVAVSEALRKVNLRGGVREEDARFYFSATFFDEDEADLDEWSAEIRFDTRDIAYEEALAGVSSWWAEDHGMTPLAVPDAARRPMYSTWYAFHQKLEEDELVAECRKAKELGFDAIIIDDGWQTLDSQRGYAYTGDWKPERLTRMGEMVEQIHDLEMKVLLWYSVPFVGKKSENFSRFKGKYLREGGDSGILDPRYPEVRAFLIDTYADAVKDWNLDGLKLDFIGLFQASSSTDLTLGDGRDYASVNEALDRLMTDITVELKAIRPDILLEFRQNYIGPLMREYGNMFRASDCPNMAVVNRVRTVDLRLLSGDTAVHSDMYMWNGEETIEAAAAQLLNVIFSVPQLSVRLDTLPKEHHEMVRFWTSYWNDNREVLLDGKFSAQRPGANYPVVYATGEKKLIAALYETPFVDLSPEQGQTVDLINATGEDFVTFKSDRDLGACRVRVWTPLGEEVSDEEMTLSAGVHALDVPSSGLLSIEPKN
ncbi:MAG: alpha-galactosidase [Verrucomicrobiota bacterium JB023]|nr:alpha-galactosidase [Verrucomicrobiota bacterium JB023]